MSNQQRVARVGVPNHLIYFVHPGRVQIDHGTKVVVVAIAGTDPQADPSLVGAHQPGIVRPAQTHEYVVVGLADGDLILKIELSGLLAAQRHRHERSGLVGVVLVHGTDHGPPGRVVAGKKVNVVQPHRRPFHFRRPAARGRIHRHQQGLGVDGNWRRCSNYDEERQQESAHASRVSHLEDHLPFHIVTRGRRIVHGQ